MLEEKALFKQFELSRKMKGNLESAHLVPRVLSYLPYGGRVGENPGNEVAEAAHPTIFLRQ